MTNLDVLLVQSIKQSPRTVEHNGVTYVIRASNARAGGQRADLEVVVGDEVKGYITPYGKDEHGAVPAGLFGRVAPQIFRTLEAALAEIA